MGLPAYKPATYEDLFDLPDHVVGEILGGEVYASPRPALPHARASSNLGADLLFPFERGKGGPGGWWIVFEPELHLGRNVLVPDLAGWRRARMPAFPKTAYMTLAPDWVCEILSPSTARLDRTLKLPIYAEEGVRHVWLLDPLAKTLEVLELREGRWMILSVHGGEDRVRAEPFDAVELDLSLLWVAEEQAEDAGAEEEG